MDFVDVDTSLVLRCATSALLVPLLALTEKVCPALFVLPPNALHPLAAVVPPNVSRGEGL